MKFLQKLTCLNIFSIISSCIVTRCSLATDIRWICGWRQLILYFFFVTNEKMKKKWIVKWIFFCGFWEDIFDFIQWFGLMHGTGIRVSSWIVIILKRNSYGGVMLLLEKIRQTEVYFKYFGTHGRALISI